MIGRAGQAHARHYPGNQAGRDGAQSGSRAAAQRLAVPGPARSGCGEQPCEAHITSCQSLLVPRRRVWRAGRSACASATCSEQYASAPQPNLLVHLNSPAGACITASRSPPLHPSFPSTSPRCSSGCVAPGIEVLGHPPALQQLKSPGSTTQQSSGQWRAQHPSALPSPCTPPRCA